MRQFKQFILGEVVHFLWYLESHWGHEFVIEALVIFLLQLGQRGQVDFFVVEGPGLGSMSPQIQMEGLIMLGLKLEKLVGV